MTRHATLCRALLVASLAIGANAPVRADPSQELAQVSAFVELMSRYYALVGDQHAIAADPDKNAVLQMTKLKEYMEKSGQQGRIPDVLKRIAETTDRPAVRNAAITMYAEAIANAGDMRSAATVLEGELLGRPAAR